jgi:hypothetical protein
MEVQVKGPVSAVEGLPRDMRTYQHPTENRTFYAPDREPTTDLPFPVARLRPGQLLHPASPVRQEERLRQGPWHLDPEAVVSHATTGSGPSASFLGSDMRAAYYGGTALTGAARTSGCSSMKAPTWPT